MDNNEKIRNKSFFNNKKQNEFNIKEFITASFEKTLGTYIMYSDDSLEEELTLKITKVKQKINDHMISHLQKFSTFDN